MKQHITVEQLEEIKLKNDVETKYLGYLLSRTEHLGCGEIDSTYKVVWQDDRYVVRGVDNNNQFELGDFDFTDCEVVDD